METISQLAKVFSDRRNERKHMISNRKSNKYQLFPVQNDLSMLYSERKGVTYEKPSVSKRQNNRRNQNLYKANVQLGVVRVIPSS